MAGTDFSHLTTDELIKGIKALDLPDYIRSKAYGIDVRETLAQMTEMTIQLGVNMGLSPDEALKWARKLQESVSQSEFDSWVATLLDGGPSIFMNTLSELQTTYPNGAAGVALVRETDPAKIYVWNGTAWEDFGNYQGIEVKDGTITNSKLADNTVSVDKTDFIITPENLFSVGQTGVSFDPETWGIISNPDFAISPPIYVNSNEEYMIHTAGTGRVVAYNKGNGAIKMTAIISTDEQVVYVPNSNTSYVRVQTKVENVDKTQVNKGSILLPYSKYFVPKIDTSKVNVLGDYMANDGEEF